MKDNYPLKDIHQLSLLARAEKDGKRVHELMIPCPGDQPGLLSGGETGRWCLFDYPENEEGWTCPCEGKDSGYVSNPDALALIASALHNDWSVNFEGDGGVDIYVTDPDDEEKVNCFIGILWLDTTLHAGLIDAIFQATEALKPDNWVKCGCGPEIKGVHENSCYDTDWLLKETA